MIVAHRLAHHAWGRTPTLPSPTTVCRGAENIYIYIYMYIVVCVCVCVRVFVCVVCLRRVCVCMWICIKISTSADRSICGQATPNMNLSASLLISPYECTYIW